MLLAGKPDVILLDEPMAGVSVEDVDDLVALIRVGPPRRKARRC